MKGFNDPNTPKCITQITTCIWLKASITLVNSCEAGRTLKNLATGHSWPVTGLEKLMKGMLVGIRFQSILNDQTVTHRTTGFNVGQFNQQPWLRHGFMWASYSPYQTRAALLRVVGHRLIWKEARRRDFLLSYYYFFLSADLNLGSANLELN